MKKEFFMEKKSEKKGIFHRIFKKIGMLALAFAMLFAGSLVMTACSNTPPPSEPPENPPEITNPKPDDSKGEEDNGETDNKGDGNKGDSGETDDNGDDNKGDDKDGGGSGGSGETEEGGGSGGDDSGNGDGNGESGEENIENLIYYQDENGETQYNVEKMIEVTFAQYNTRQLNKRPYSYSIVGIDEINNENTKVLVSRFNIETEVTQLDLLLFVTDDEGVYRLVKVEQKIDLGAVGGNTITDLENYYNGLNILQFAPTHKNVIDYATPFDSTFVPGEDEVADSIVDIIKADSIIDTIYEGDKENPPIYERVSNPDFEYVLGFRTKEKQANEGYVVCPDGSIQAVGLRWEVISWYLINKDGNLYLIKYSTYINIEQNFTKYGNDIGKTFLGNLKNKEYYINRVESETELFSNYTMEYSRENLPLDKATN